MSGCHGFDSVSVGIHRDTPDFVQIDVKFRTFADLDAFMNETHDRLESETRISQWVTHIDTDVFVVDQDHCIST